ncbi:MAG: energy-coupling factor ABC transporter ATP-binding protein [Treponema sp.]|nr:energy-coupling factor ABC transporter ATP-binding protein [Treponema sp.]
MVEIEGVSWRYAGSGRKALRNLGMRIEPGEFVAVMGANGAGKTSLCRLLGGLIPHSLPGSFSGRVRIDGTDTRLASAATLARKVGMAFDDPDNQLFGSCVFDEVAFALENLLFSKEEITARANRAIAAAGLGDLARRSPATLSGGERQRLAIAAACAMADRLLVLDEPCTRLDPAGRLQVLSFVRKLRLEGKLTVVMATAAPEEAAEFADRICLLKEGRLLALASPAEIFADSELCLRAGIGIPDVCRLALELADRGSPLSPFPLDVSGAVTALLAKKREPIPDAGGQAMPNLLRRLGSELCKAKLHPFIDKSKCVEICKANLRVHPSQKDGPTPPQQCPEICEANLRVHPSRKNGPVPPPSPEINFPALEIRNLGYRYPERPENPALDRLDLTVEKGEFVAIVGENGSGKTTLLKTVAGLLRPDSGRIAVAGRDTSGMDPAEISGELGFVMQDGESQLFTGSVFEEVAFALRLRAKKAGRGLAGRAEIEAKVRAALDLLGIAHLAAEFPQALPKADRTRTVLAAVVAMGADILLLDEPLDGQDFPGAASLMRTVSDLRSLGKTVILVTHDIRAAATHAKRIVIMKAGRVFLDAPPEEAASADPDLLAAAGIILPPLFGLCRELRPHFNPEKPVPEAGNLAGILAPWMTDTGNGRT